MSKNNDLEINVMMVGGNRCGKTSVLASMQECFAKAQKNTPLVINCANDETLNTIIEKREEMKHYFAAKGTEKTFVPSEEPTRDISEYPFSIGL